MVRLHGLHHANFFRNDVLLLCAYNFETRVECYINNLRWIPLTLILRFINKIQVYEIINYWEQLDRFIGLNTVTPCGRVRSLDCLIF